MIKYRKILLVLIVIVASCKQNNKSAFDDTDRQAWWKEAVVYQIYPRSFQDSDGDGVGDIRGIISRLDYIKSLGVDMVWLNPIYVSPQKDNGYDISDYENIDPVFGTMKDFEEMVKGFHERGIKVMMDMVLNHCSDEHRWFKEARKSRNSPYYNYFHWWPAEKGEPPYRWSIFDDKGYGWEYNKATNSYYLHYFADFQPDLNWENPKVREELYKIMRYWLQKGVDGFRMDALAFISKDTTWPPLPAEYKGNWTLYYASGPKLHEYIQELNREVLSRYDVVTVAEAVGDIERVKKFVDRDRKELNMAYHFEAVDFGYQPGKYKTPDPKGWDLVKWKKIFARWDSAMVEKGWNTVYLGNHDQPRMLTRWGNDSVPYRNSAAKMLSTFILTMRGTPYYYYGDEIGMSNIKFNRIEDYKDVELLTNYAQLKSKGGDLREFLEAMKITSRDNGRTPMQWNSSVHAGFTKGTPWLPVNSNYKFVNVAAQEQDSSSVLNYFRRLIKYRKNNKILIYGSFRLVDEQNPDVFAYVRETKEKKILVALNFKNKNSYYVHDLPAEKLKLVMGNNINPSSPGTLKPYEAVIYELQ
ncbi:MAG: alpha-glucosidase [Chitinophagaceae bacterium]|nr:alpha-glucosidase [Chitinophagaceae bacterium]